MIKFRVNGLPAPQGSKRHVGHGRMVESSRAVGPWREAVRAEAVQEARLKWGLPAEGMINFVEAGLQVTIVFIFRRPKSHYRTGKWSSTELRDAAPAYPATRPDVDKLARAVLDGLVMGGVMADDAQVVSLNCAKVYASNGEAPGAIIEVDAM